METAQTARSQPGSKAVSAALARLATRNPTHEELELSNSQETRHADGWRNWEDWDDYENSGAWREEGPERV